MGRYDDIINIGRPKSYRTPMDVANRAKIFMPFAALKGYEEAIVEQQKLVITRTETIDKEPTGELFPEEGI
ncbi:MAG: hypothetical protein E7261_04900 [Lachnospiraceae bacterium]|nr:hypothetical protein [Lachnospiraceae bacterium]